MQVGFELNPQRVSSKPCFEDRGDFVGDGWKKEKKEKKERGGGWGRKKEGEGGGEEGGREGKGKSCWSLL